MNPTTAPTVQQVSPSAPPVTYTRRAAVLDRRSAKVVDRAGDAGVPITYLGIAPLFAETRAYPGPTTDWVIGPVTSLSEAVIPRAERATLVKLLDAGIDFPMIYIAHEVPKGRLDIPENQLGSRPTTVDQATAEAAVGPVPPPAAATALADQLGHNAQWLLRAMGIALAGAGAIVAAPFILAGAAVATVGALALDPIVFGVIPAGQPVPGELGAWYTLAQWDWPAIPQAAR